MAVKVGGLVLLDAVEQSQLVHLADLLENGDIAADYRPGWVDFLRSIARNPPRLPAQEPVSEYTYHYRPPGKTYLERLTRPELVTRIGETVVGLLETAARADEHGHAHHGRLPDGETFVAYNVRCE